MAFELTHNLIQDWVEREHSTVATQNSYSLRNVEGLCRLAEEENAVMKNVAKEAEQKALAARI